MPRLLRACLMHVLMSACAALHVAGEDSQQGTTPDLGDTFHQESGIG